MITEIRNLIVVILLSLSMKILPDCEFKKLYIVFIKDNIKKL